MTLRVMWWPAPGANLLISRSRPRELVTTRCPPRRSWSLSDFGGLSALGDEVGGGLGADLRVLFPAFGASPGGVGGCGSAGSGVSGSGGAWGPGCSDTRSLPEPSAQSTGRSELFLLCSQSSFWDFLSCELSFRFFVSKSLIFLDFRSWSRSSSVICALRALVCAFQTDCDSLQCSP